MLACYMYIVELLIWVSWLKQRCSILPQNAWQTVLKPQLMLFYFLLPTTIIGLEAFKWSDGLKVCYSRDKLHLLLVSILQSKLSQIQKDVNRSVIYIVKTEHIPETIISQRFTNLVNRYTNCLLDKYSLWAHILL